MSTKIERLTEEFQAAAVANLKAQRAYSEALQVSIRLDEARQDTDMEERKAARALINALGEEATNGI